MPGKGWFDIRRLYGALEPWFDKTWRPGEIDLVKSPAPHAGYSMNYVPIAILCTLSLLIGIMVIMELGRRIGVRRLARRGDNVVAGVAAIDGAVFALLGLLLAFTFSGAASRFDTRRQQIVEEANDIGTAYLLEQRFVHFVQPTNQARKLADDCARLFGGLEIGAREDIGGGDARLQLFQPARLVITDFPKFPMTQSVDRVGTSQLLSYPQRIRPCQ
jgi:hypothetical protein